MKKRLLFFLFTAIAGTLTALADDYIWVSGKEMPFNSSWSHDYTYFKDSYRGSVSWDATTHTLTLKSIGIRRYTFVAFYSRTCIDINSTQSVIIKLEGYNNLETDKGQALKLHGNTTFTGNGNLSIVAFDEKKPGIDLMEENLTITLDGPTLDFYGYSGTKYAIRGENNTGTLHLKKGKIIGQSNKKTLEGFSHVVFDYGMGVTYPHGAYFSPSKHCMVDKDGDVIKGVEFGSIEYYGLAICGKWITENNYDLINKMDFVKSGDVHYDPGSNTLYLDNATIVNNSSAPTIQNESNDDLDIQLTGNNIFKFEGEKERWAMSLKENTQINGKFTDEGFLHVIDADYAGIHVGADKCLSLQAVTLNIPYLKGGNTKSSLDIFEDVEINATGNSKLGTLSFLRVGEEMRDNVAVESTVSQPRFYWNRGYNRASGVYANLNELAKGPVHISTKAKSCPVDICGQGVNALNKNNIINQYLKSGRIYYDDEGLHLYNAELDYDIDNFEDMADPALKFYSDSHIYLEGTNKIKCNDVKAIKTSKDLTIQNYASYASLTIEGPNAEIYTSGTLKLLDTKVTAPEISASELDVYGSWLNVTRKLEADKVSLSEEKVASTPDAPAYYDSEKQQIVAPKGPVSFLPSSEVTVYDGIQFCGEEINSANASCLMNEYVKDGSVEVKKMSDGYQVHLHDVSVNNDSSNPVFMFGNIEGTSFYLYGDNNITSTTNPFISGDAKQLTLRGESSGEEVSINVNGSNSTNAGAIAVPAGGKLSIYKNLASKLNVSVPRIYGQGTSSSLYVYDPYLNVTGNSKGTVSDIKCELSSRAELYNTSSMPREIKSDGIYSSGSICTEEVKFVKKGESYIPVTSVVVTPEELLFTKRGEVQALTAIVLPTDATNKKVYWWSRDESIVTVDSKGNVKAVGNGTTIVTAGTEDVGEDFVTNVSRNIVVTVDIPKPTAVSLPSSILFDNEGTSSNYVTATLTPSDAETEYTWTSSDENIVTVKENSGKTALIRRVADEGTATITVTTANGLSASCDVTIHFPITPEIVEFTPRTYTLTEEGQQIKLVPIVKPANCEKLSFTWYTYGEAISLTDDGTVTALRNGSAVVECWACYDGQKWAPGEVRINVEIPPTPVIATGLTISPSSVAIFYSLGESVWLKPVFTPENVTNDSVTWATTDASVATVDENGLLTVVGWGDCDITATTTDGSGITARRWIQAIDPSTLPEPVYATGIRLSDNEVTLMRGEEARIGLTVEPADYTESIMIEPLEGDVSIAQVNAEWDWNTNQNSIYIRSEEWSEMSGDMKWVVRPNAVDWEKLNAMGIWEEPRDTLTIHVLAPIIFAEASPEDINITYHVTDVNEKICEVYTQTRPGSTMIDPLDSELIPAVSQTATGKLTVPAKANGYWVTNVMPCAFNRCSGLTEIEFSEGIESIGDYACYSALFSLERVTLPSTIEELGSYCFSANFSDYSTSDNPSGRNNLREVNIKAFTPPTVNGSFDYIAEDAVLYVPTGALEAYNVYPWTYWFSRIEEKQFFEDYDGIRDLKDSKDLKDLKDIRDSWYTLDGRMVSGQRSNGKLPKGLYIKNGKKVVVK